MKYLSLSTTYIYSNSVDLELKNKYLIALNKLISLSNKYKITKLERKVKKYKV